MDECLDFTMIFFLLKILLFTHVFVQTSPVMDIVAGQWYRWRICYSSLLTTAEFTLSDSSCEMQLLAKDGAYLPTFPRLVQHLPLYPGARADVAVRCDGSVSTVTLDAHTFEFPSVALLQIFTGVLVLNVVNEGSAPASDLPSITVRISMCSITRHAEALINSCPTPSVSLLLFD